MYCSNDYVFRVAAREAYCDYAIVDKSSLGKTVIRKLIVASMFNRSNSELRSLTANLFNNEIILFSNEKKQNVQKLLKQESYDCYFSIQDLGYERYTHSIVTCSNVQEKYIICDNQAMLEELLYDHLMHKFDLPLMRQWMSYITNRLINEKLIYNCVEVYGNSKDQKIEINQKVMTLSSISVYKVENITESSLENIVSSGLEKKEILITEKQQNPLFFTDMDSYFLNYGNTIVENLETKIEPLTDIKPFVDELSLKNIELYGQQASLVNGLVALFNKSKYGIMNEGMGCGKTIQAAATIEAYFVKKHMMKTGDTIKDIYLDPSKINYRIVIMSPGHLVEKWANECRNEIPFAKVTILTELKQLVEIKNRGITRNGREIFVLGKDFGKLSHGYAPVPKKYVHKAAVYYRCNECKSNIDQNDYRRIKKCTCGSNKIEKIPSTDKQYGLMCPNCEELLVRSDMKALQAKDFSNKTSDNLSCYLCGDVLWQPNVKNLNGKLRDSKWYKISHYANKTRKSRITAWVLKGKELGYYEDRGIIKQEVEQSNDVSSRKVSPASYIKKQLKGFFDFAIFDEVHVFKGGATAQGNAMHALCKSSNKILCLTGTISGGFAEHLFYLFYRLDPRRMQKLGYKYNSVMDFIKKYGTLETCYTVERSGSSEYNKTTKGKKAGRVAMKPGISPLIFRDFLMDKTVYLDLSDMSNYLPSFTEEVVSVGMDSEIRSSYRSVISRLKSINGNGLNSLTAAMLQFSLSYPDKPYGYGTIIDPKTGHIAVVPEDFENSRDDLYSKELKLIELITSELNEERNVFVYCEYTGDGKQNATKRLFDIIEYHCNLKNQVAILESSKPKAAEREQWIHKMASKGTRVFITNPRCVETGLDFIFKENGVQYNYPTIIFYQLGYNLFTLWQASRRSYRLNQTEPCKVYYLAYKGTIQEEVIRIMAEKQVATAAIQGKFSSEGLSAMSNGIDARVRLIKKLLDNSYDEPNSDDNSLKNMFSIMNKNNNTYDESSQSKQVGNHNYYTLVGIDKEKEKNYEVVTSSSTQLEVFGVLDGLLDGFLGNDLSKKVAIEETDNVVIVNDQKVVVTNTIEIAVPELIILKTVTNSKKYHEGQLSLF